MKNLRNPRGFAGRITKVLCLILSVGMVMIGVPITNAHACYVSTDDPADGCIREVKLDSPQMSVTGRSVSVPPGTEVTFTAHAINESGQSTGCANGWKFRVDGRDIDMGDAANDTIRVRSGSSGMPEVAAVCKDNPSIGHAPVTVKNSVLGFKVFEQRTELAFLGASSSTAVNAGVNNGSFGSSPPPPTPGQPSGTETTSSSSNVGGILLGIGAVALGGLALGSYLKTQQEEQQKHCNSGYSYCRTPGLCCPTSYPYYCTNKKVCISMDSDAWWDGSCGTKYWCERE